MFSIVKRIIYQPALETINENEIVNEYKFSRQRDNIKNGIEKVNNFKYSDSSIECSSVCNKKCSKSNNKKMNKFYFLSLLKEEGDLNWSIHGLWPQYDISTYPTFCKKVVFDENKLKPIIDDLNKYWTSNCEKNDKFWEHEWKKHGSCVFTDIDELEYFKTTIKLYKEALKLKLPYKYYNKAHKQCLIPVTMGLELLDVELLDIKIQQHNLRTESKRTESNKKIRDSLKIN